MKKAAIIYYDSAARQNSARAGTPRCHAHMSGRNQTLAVAIKVLLELIKINKICRSAVFIALKVEIFDLRFVRGVHHALDNTGKHRAPR